MSLARGYQRLPWHSSADPQVVNVSHDTPTLTQDKHPLKIPTHSTRSQQLYDNDNEVSLYSNPRLGSSIKSSKLGHTSASSPPNKLFRIIFAMIGFRGRKCKIQ